MAWWPRMRSSSSARLAEPVDQAGQARHPEVLGQRPCGVVEAHRPVGLAADELAHLRVLRLGELLRRSLGDDLAARRHQVGVVADLEALGDVVRDQDGGRAGGVVEGADQVGGDRHRDRVEAGERLVVHDQLGVEGDRARERDAARHAARDLGDVERRRAAQADRVQLHQHDVADHGLVEVGVLAQREGDVLEDREIGEQGAELEQHAEPAPQREQLLRDRGRRRPCRRRGSFPEWPGGRRRSGAAASSCRSPSRRGSP